MAYRREDLLFQGNRNSRVKRCSRSTTRLEIPDHGRHSPWIAIP
uniref:Uncharacterized protein n=1 Tax=Anguilla anguilla TaxID=7936 RepID=A0A0E9WDY9_ANGAN